jgi:tetratricopeptide (TPR) repeat protein
MDEFINGNYNNSIEHWQSILENESLSNIERLIMLNNIATAELKLEMYRKCLKTTQMIIDNDETFLASYVIQGKAYALTDKPDKAIEVWTKAFQYCDSNSIFDCSIILELQNLINYHKQNKIILDNQKECNIKIEPKKHDVKEPISNSNTSKSDLTILYEEFILGSHIEASFLRKVRSNLSFASGDNMIDDLIAFGYLQVNTSKLDNACQVFSKLLKYNDNLPAAYLGLGSANAMLGQYDEAISLFTKVIIKDSTIADAWKRRGQTRAAKGLFQDALNDLEKAVELGTDADVYYQIGLVYHQCKNFRKALDQFKKAYEKGIYTSSLLNFIGICEGQLGNIDESLKAHELAIQLDPNFKEGLLNHALMLKEVGRWKEAEFGFEQVIKLDGNQTFHQALSYKATFLYQLGDPLESFHYSLRALEILKKTGNVEISSLILAANAMHSIGHYKTAIIYYDKALAIDSSNFCWFQREIALFTWNRLDRPLYQLNDDLNPRIKDGFCKKSKWEQILNHNYVPLSSPNEIPTFEDVDERYNIEQQEIMLKMIRPLIPLVQLNARGFLPNKRQHKSFGLAVLEMAQTMRAAIQNGGEESTSKLSWRKFFDIAVKWRHISEPGDPVFWIDTLPRKAFEDGFGLQTPIVNGQLKTIRYYSYYPQAFSNVVPGLSYWKSPNAASTCRPGDSPWPWGSVWS